MGEKTVSQHLATAATEWASRRDVASERSLADALEVWLLSVFPDEDGWEGRWTDGLTIDSAEVISNRFSIQATVFRVSPQTRHPTRFELAIQDDDVREFWVSLQGDSRADQIVIQSDFVPS